LVGSALLVKLEIPVLPVQKEEQVQLDVTVCKERLALLVSLVRVVIKVLKVPLGFSVPLVLSDRLVVRVLKGIKARKVQPEAQEHRVPRDNKGNKDLLDRLAILDSPEPVEQVVSRDPLD